MSEHTQLDYEAFRAEFVRRLNVYLSEKGEIMVHVFPKNNSVHEDTIAVKDQGSDAYQCVPLAEYWEKYQKGAGFTTLCAAFEEKLGRAVPAAVDIGQITSPERARDWIIPKLIGVKFNQELLAGAPYVPFLDLAVTFRIYFPMMGPNAFGSTLVSQEMAAIWGMDTEQLYQCAMDNAQRMFQPEMCLIAVTCAGSGELDCREDLRMDRRSSALMYSLSTEPEVFGASVIVREGLLQGIAERSRSNFYLLPSSTEEVFLVPARKNDRMGQMNEQVRAANSRPDIVAPKLVLSDHAYFYDRDRGRLIY